MKVLLITHTPFSTYNNMGKTFSALFEKFDTRELCQLYIYPSIPDVEKCGSFYRITDKDVLKSLYRFHVDGKEVLPDCRQHELYEDEQDRVVYTNKIYQTATARLLRDILWKIAPWMNRGLSNWIAEQAPTCIFVAPGQAKFIYDVCLKISRKYHLPIISYFADDYYDIKSRKSILAIFQHRLLQRKIRQLLKASTVAITICDKMQKLYEKLCDCSVITIMTGSSVTDIKMVKLKEEPSTITYMGNIWLNRYLSIAAIGKALDVINVEHNTNYKLQIYTHEQAPEILSCFESIQSIELGGFVSGSEFKQVFEKAKIFLHVEAFDAENAGLVKYSISTKIADCLASGKPLIAYGPAEIASVEYLRENDAAIVLTEPYLLKDQLWNSLQDLDLQQKVTSNAQRLVKKNHNTQTNSKRLHELCESLG